MGQTAAAGRAYLPSDRSYDRSHIGARPPVPGTEAADGWPGARLSDVPTGEREVRAVVAQVCAWWRVSTAAALNPERLLRALGCEIIDETLSAAAGGHQALLVPRSRGGFTVFVDPTLTPLQRRAGHTERAVRRARLAHEFAHTLFYVPGTPPRRCAPLTEAEEVFCDAFAQAVTGVSGRTKLDD